MASKYVVAAICGNCYQESGFYPGAESPDQYASYGLFQWTASRKSNLLAYLDSKGLSYNDGYGQLDFLVQEADWQKVYSDDGYTHTSAYDSFSEFMTSTSTDVNELTLEFCYHWERPDYSSAALSTRQSAGATALEIINLGDTSITAVFPDSSIKGSYSIENGVSIAVTKAIWNTLGDDTPIPPTPTKRKLGWLMIKRRRFYSC